MDGYMQLRTTQNVSFLSIATCLPKYLMNDFLPYTELHLFSLPKEVPTIFPDLLNSTVAPLKQIISHKRRNFSKQINLLDPALEHGCVIRYTQHHTTCAANLMFLPLSLPSPVS